MLLQKTLFLKFDEKLLCGKFTVQSSKSKRIAMLSKLKQTKRIKTNQKNQKRERSDQPKQPKTIELQNHLRRTKK